MSAGTDYRDIFAYCRRLAAQGDTDALLRHSGEGLAAAGEKLRTAGDDADRLRHATDAAVFSELHVKALVMAGMYGQAVATAAMTPVFVISSRIDPESMASVYLLMLKTLADSTLAGLQQATPDKQDAFLESAAMALALLSVTTRHFVGSGIADAGMLPLADDADDDLGGFDDHTRTLAARIRPKMALDICSAIVSLMHSAGEEI